MNTTSHSYRTTKFFSLIELLVAIAIIGTLAAIILPGLMKSKEKARFVRWLAFNRQCSNDPACVLNLNFQEGDGEPKNSATGAKFDGYNQSNYKCKVLGDCEWGEGRWKGMKKGIIMPGHGSIVEIDCGKDSNLRTYDNYTLVFWVCFDYDPIGGTLLSKGLMGKQYLFAQLHIHPTMSYDKEKESFNVNFRTFATGHQTYFTGKVGNDYDAIRIKKHEWVMLTLRNEVKGDNKKIVSFFLNDKQLSAGYIKEALENQDYTCPIWIGGVRYQTGANNEPVSKASAYGFSGRIDELILYKRALSDQEIKGHYEMGKLH